MGRGWGETRALIFNLSLFLSSLMGYRKGWIQAAQSRLNASPAYFYASTALDARNIHSAEVGVLAEPGSRASTCTLQQKVPIFQTCILLFITAKCNWAQPGIAKEEWVKSCSRSEKWNLFLIFSYVLSPLIVANQKGHCPSVSSASAPA